MRHGYQRSMDGIGRFLLLVALSGAVFTVAPEFGGGDARAAHWGDPNPLGITPTPPKTNPLLGARFFVDEEWGLANRAQRACRTSRCSKAMGLIASQPETKRFGTWNVDPGLLTRQYLDRANEADPSTVPLLATYGLTHAHCGNYSDSLGAVARFKAWYRSFAAGIGTHRAVVFADMDGLITMGCLSRQGRIRRYAELSYAMRLLTALPHTVVYLDGGAADADTAAHTATGLVASGGLLGQGFFVNSTHYDWTTRELAYAQAVARRLPAGRHFVVSTSVNGRGPLVPRNRVRDGNEVRCNPSGRGLGPRPTTTTGFLGADAFAWIGNPGRSTGVCHPGDPATGVFWNSLAVSLAEKADFRVLGPSRYKPARTH